MLITGYLCTGTAMFDISPSIEPSTGYPSNWTLEFWNLSQSSHPKSFVSKMLCTRNSSSPYAAETFGAITVNAALNGIQIVSDGGAGNFLSGRMTLYGVAHA